MLRRLAVSLLCAAIVTAGIVTASCASGVCPMAQAEMDCCKGPPVGISAPGCCDRAPELSRNTTPATADRPTQNRLNVALGHRLPVAAVAITVPAGVPHRFASQPAPPGNTLVAQHTSLLL